MFCTKNLCPCVFNWRHAALKYLTVDACTHKFVRLLKIKHAKLIVAFPIISCIRLALTPLIIYTRCSVISAKRLAWTQCEMNQTRVNRDHNAWAKVISDHVAWAKVIRDHVAWAKVIRDRVAWAKVIRDHVAWAKVIRDHVAWARTSCCVWSPKITWASFSIVI